MTDQTQYNPYSPPEVDKPKAPRGKLDKYIFSAILGAGIAISGTTGKKDRNFEETAAGAAIGACLGILSKM